MALNPFYIIFQSTISLSTTATNVSYLTSDIALPSFKKQASRWSNKVEQLQKSLHGNETAGLTKERDKIFNVIMKEW